MYDAFVKALIVAAAMAVPVVAFVAIKSRPVQTIDHGHPWVPPSVYINDLEVAMGREMFPEIPSERTAIRGLTRLRYRANKASTK